MIKRSAWFRKAKPGSECTFDTRCASCRPNGDCDPCNTIDGRNIEAVSDYASTCDWCGELTHHDRMAMDPETQLGYCEKCLPKLPRKIRARIQESAGRAT